MPPKKRARTATTTAASPAPSIDLSITNDSTHLHILKRNALSRPSTPSAFPTSPTDPWTTAQETALFKALIRYKPTGIHKHFHMLCISSFLRSHGHTLLPPPNGESQERLVSHTRIAGIWEKLGALFDLQTLDEREDQHALALAKANEPDRAEEVDVDVDESGEEWIKDFALPESNRFIRRGMSSDDEEDEEETTFGDMMWQRRFPSTAEAEEIPSSPLEMPLFRGRDGVVENNRMSASPAPTVGSTRRGKRQSRGGAAAAAAPPAAVTRRQSLLQTAGRASRRSIRLDSETKSSPAPAQENEEEKSSEDEEEDEDDEDGEDTEESEEQAAEESDAKRTKTQPTRGARRGRPPRGGRGGAVASTRRRRR